MSRIASKKMLLYEITLAHKRCYPRAEFGSAEGAYDELTQQTRDDCSDSSALFESRQNRESQILDELIATTGYHRKSAIRVLKHGSKPKGLKKPGRKKIYQGEVVQVLEQIWEICGRICSKRLQPFLPEIVTILERHHELCLSSPNQVAFIEHEPFNHRPLPEKSTVYLASARALDDQTGHAAQTGHSHPHLYALGG